MPAWLEHNRRLFDLIIIDTPAYDGAAIADAVRVADLTLIVTQPTTLATAVAMRLGRLFIDHNIPFAILLSQTPPRLTSRLSRWISDHRELGTVVEGQFAFRFAYQDVVTLGMGVVEYEPDGQAASEVKIVTDWILRKLELIDDAP